MARSVRKSSNVRVRHSIVVARGFGAAAHRSITPVVDSIVVRPPSYSTAPAAMSCTRACVCPSAVLMMSDPTDRRTSVTGGYPYCVYVTGTPIGASGSLTASPVGFQTSSRSLSDDAFTGLENTPSGAGTGRTVSMPVCFAVKPFIVLAIGHLLIRYAVTVDASAIVRILDVSVV